MKILERDDIILRFYIINTEYLEHTVFIDSKSFQSRILYSRPTRWKVFLQGLFRLDTDLAFVRLPDSIVQEFKSGKIVARYADEHLLKINAHSVEIERWTFWNLCKFCIEGIQYATFQRFFNWRW